MSVDPKVLEAKIKAFYPEIVANNLDMSVRFDAASQAWMVRLAKGADELETHLEAADAEGCLAGRECVHLTAQVARFIEAYCLRGTSCARK